MRVNRFLCFFSHIYLFAGPLLTTPEILMKKSLLTLIFFLRIIQCAINIFPKFEEIKETSPEDISKVDEHACPLTACQRRFRAYSDVDFNERAACDKKTKHEGVKYGNFFEFLRVKIIESDLKFVEIFEKSILEHQLNFPLLKLWLMMDKLMRDPSISKNEALIEYILLVVKLTKDSCDSTLFKPALESLKHAIRSRKPAIILKTLMKFLKPHMNQKESLTVFKIIYTSMPSTGNFSKDLKTFLVALEELDPIGWFDYIFNEGLTVPSHVLLSPFYFLLSKHEQPQQIIAPVYEILENCVFDQNRDNLKTLSKFIEMTDFCSGGEVNFERKSEIFKFILSKFEIEAADYENQFNSAVERKFTSLVEVFLLYTEILTQDSDTLGHHILNALYTSTNEIAVLIITYRPICADELSALWKNLPFYVKLKFKSVRIGVIIDLLKLANDFDSDYADVVEYTNKDGFIIHPFPEPEEYEHIAKKPANSVSPSVLNNNWIARIILSKYFGISFTSTRINYEYDSSPIWREVAGAVNSFLFIKKSNHRVYYDEEQRPRNNFQLKFRNH